MSDAIEGGRRMGEVATGYPDENRARRLLAAASIIQYRYGLTDYLGHTSVRLTGGGRTRIKPKHSPTCPRNLTQLTRPPS